MLAQWEQVSANSSVVTVAQAAGTHLSRAKYIPTGFRGFVCINLAPSPVAMVPAAIYTHSSSHRAGVRLGMQVRNHSPSSWCRHSPSHSLTFCLLSLTNWAPWVFHKKSMFSNLLIVLLALLWILSRFPCLNCDTSTGHHTAKKVTPVPNREVK